jgi:MoaA/NifB/PqqE/SkfB family radical SAM enzyme
MPVTIFAQTLDRLLELDLARPVETVVHLHNWGEPILHPDLNGIVAELNARNLRVAMSTNVSKATNFTVSTAGFAVVNFSMPGWSQASYDKIHGLNFERVVSNMEITLTNMRDRGFAGPYMLAFHVYQFNWSDELTAARNWCTANGVEFMPYYAYINDYEPAKRFLKSKMESTELSQLSRSLFFHYIDGLLASQPKDWKCPQWTGSLTLNHKAEVLLCCVVPLDHHAAALGSIFDMSREEILRAKVLSAECDDCMGCGLAYWAHNPLRLNSAQIS